MVLVYAMCGLISVLAEQSVMEMGVIHLHTKTKHTAYILHTYTVTLIIFHLWTFTLMTIRLNLFTFISLFHWPALTELHVTISHWWPWHSVTVRPPCLLLTDWDGPESGPRSPAASGRPLDSAPRPPVHHQPAANTAQACVYHIMYYILCCLYIALYL